MLRAAGRAPATSPLLAAAEARRGPAAAPAISRPLAQRLGLTPRMQLLAAEARHGPAAAQATSRPLAQRLGPTTRMQLVAAEHRGLAAVQATLRPLVGSHSSTDRAPATWPLAAEVALRDRADPLQLGAARWRALAPATAAQRARPGLPAWASQPRGRRQVRATFPRRANARDAATPGAVAQQPSAACSDSASLADVVHAGQAEVGEDLAARWVRCRASLSRSAAARQACRRGRPARDATSSCGSAGAGPHADRSAPGC